MSMVPAKKSHASHKPSSRSARSHRPKEIRPVNFRMPAWTGWALVGVFVAVLIASFVVFYSRGCSQADEVIDNQPEQQQGIGLCVSYPGRTIDYARKFSSINSTHLAAAKRVGIAGPLEKNADVKNYKSKMVKVATCKNYKVDRLEHSLPYLTKGAAAELDAIAADFADILERNDLPHYRFIVTSVLRTKESVRQLQKSGNINSTTNSAHCYGTTFDITYARFDKADLTLNYMTDENLKLVLAQALLNEQRAGNIYVKYERKQACFHVTSRK